VLVAEDDESLGAVLARGLREQGYVVDLVPDGETAASYLRFYQYEVAVLDWRMPKLSGLDLGKAPPRRHGQRVHAGADADRPGYPGGPDRRPGRGRG
jgi:DNA-binding response OmpR family regulator